MGARFHRGPDFARRAKQDREVREQIGRCVHCRAGTAYGSVYVNGAPLRLCARCAGDVRRTGSLPQVAP